jgi:thioesterase domain-containing protein
LHSDLPPAFAYLVPIKRGQLPPLYLVHSVAGELTWLPRLAAALPHDQPLYGFAAPGLNVDAPFFPSMEAMASAYLCEMRRVQPSGPYMIGGYSMGGVVAFEMARQLHEAGESVEWLVMIDSFAPGRAGGPTITSWSRNGVLMQVVTNQLALQWGASTLLPADALPALPYTEHSECAARHLLAHCNSSHSYGTLQPYLRRCQTVMRVHAQLLADYRPVRLTRACNTLLFRNTLGLIARDSALDLPKLPDMQCAPTHGWGPLLAMPATEIPVEEEHFLMGGQQTMNLVGKTLTSVLLSKHASRQAPAKPARA